MAEIKHVKKSNLQSSSVHVHVHVYLGTRVRTRVRVASEVNCSLQVQGFVVVEAAGGGWVLQGSAAKKFIDEVLAQCDLTDESSGKQDTEGDRDRNHAQAGTQITHVTQILQELPFLFTASSTRALLG